MPVPRTKTFTGCWTCRTRKIKCDLRRPTCARCEKANAECEGYSIKLRWSTVGDGEIDEEFFQRRNIDFVEYPPDMMFESYEEMDLTLAKLHSPSFNSNETLSLGPFGVFEGVFKPRKPSSKFKRKKASDDYNSASSTSGSSKRHHSPYAGSISPPASSITTPGSQNDRSDNMINNFPGSSGSLTRVRSIIDIDPSLDRNPSSSSSRYGMNVILENDNLNLLEDFYDKDNASESALQLLTPQQENPHQNPQLSPLLHLPQLPPLPPQTSRLFSDSSPDENGIHSTSPPPSTNVSPLFRQQYGVLDSNLMAAIQGSPVNRYLSVDNNFGLPITSLYFTLQSRQLLHHYIQNVARLMTVVIHPKTPWKTIYIPRVFSALGDLIGTGTTASARNALLHALLAVSAFHLQSKFPEDSEGKRHFLGLGLQLKSEAYKWLSECLTMDISQQKYKDVVTAVLSMVTIDVVWGSMSDCQVHLSACKRIVKMRRISGTKMSTKAQVLHRICAFLSLMQESTSLDPQTMSDMSLDESEYDAAQDYEDMVNLSLDELAANGRNSWTRQSWSMENPEKSSSSPGLKSLSYMNDPSQFQEYWGQYDNGNTVRLSDDFYERELVSTHSMYGVPDSLILLFSRTCKLTRQTVYYRSRESFPKTFSQKCSELESALVSWQTKYDLSKISNFCQDVKQAIEHHTLSFHQALIIYYYRLVRDVNPTILQTNVISVLEHLEQMQQLNHNQNEPIALPLMFPAFIAACEAIDDNLQRRFEVWLDQLAVEGLGTYYVARRVISEVWRRRRTAEGNADWWLVIREWNTNLMLS